MASTAGADAPTRPPEDGTAAPSPVWVDDRVVAAFLRCVARWGLAKTTLDDVAREAGCSRATIYRLFPGGKPTLMEQSVTHEAAQLLARIDAAAAPERTLEDVLVSTLHVSSRFLRGHAALGFLIRHEPGVVLPHITFDRVSPVVELAVAHLTHLLEPRVGHPVEAQRLAEWVVRLVLTYTFTPGDLLDLRDPADARRLVSGFMAPGLVIRPEPAPPLASAAPLSPVALAAP